MTLFKKIVVLVCAFFVLPFSVFADVAYDAGSQIAQTSGSPATLTWSHTVTGSNTLLLVMVKLDACSGCSNPTATYNGVAMTLKQAYQGTTGTGKIYVFSLPGAATGAHNIVVTQGAVKATFAKGEGISYTGVDQTNPIGANIGTANANTGTLTTTATSDANNQWSVLSAGGEGTITAGAGSTLRLTGSDITYNIYDSNANLTPIGSKSMSVTVNNETNAIMVFVSPVYVAPSVPSAFLGASTTIGTTTAQLIGATSLGLAIIILLLSFGVIVYTWKSFERKKPWS